MFYLLGNLMVSIIAGFFGFFIVLSVLFNIREIGINRRVLLYFLFGAAILFGGYLFVRSYHTNLIPLWIGYGIAFPTLLIIKIGRIKKKDGTIEGYTGFRSHVTIPKGTEAIAKSAFENGSMSSVTIPDSVKEIGECAFSKCDSLESVIIPVGITMIRRETFRHCSSLTSVSIPDSVKEIGEKAFFQCKELPSLTIPNRVTKIGPDAFADCPGLTVVCGEDSYAHRYCLENKLSFIFDYQFKAFNGLLPPGFEKLASPFQADEERPYIFISYSHKDRDAVLPILKTLYESGWKIWYDEGLTIGDRYDETLEEHVRNCSAFLLFCSVNSASSYYCIKNEIPWAIENGRPIIRCNLTEGLDFKIKEGAVASTVAPADIEPALKKISALTKGERREARGISVVVNPADRDGAAGDGFAYCLYTGKNASSAKAIMLEAKNSGCTLYDAVEDGADEEKQQNCACLIVFLDQAFLSDKDLTKILTESYQAGRDIAVCQMESIRNDDLPQELLGLHKMQWLNYTSGISADMNTKLARHLQKRGCRNAAILPGFEYEKTADGIIIQRYTGVDPNPRIESEYGGIPVVEIADNAFANCARLNTFVIPEHVTTIGKRAFARCGNLVSVTVPDGVTGIGDHAFEYCENLTSVTIPPRLKEISPFLFSQCGSLESIRFPDGITKIGKSSFSDCHKLTSVTIPSSVMEIGDNAFKDSGLKEITVPGNVGKIGSGAFEGCSLLSSVVLQEGMREIGERAFKGCIRLASIDIPRGVKEIAGGTFQQCSGLKTVRLPEGLTRIGARAFLYCTGIISMRIPHGVTKIEDDAFSNCFKLAALSLPDSVQEIGENAFGDQPRFLTLYCEPGSYCWEYAERNNMKHKPREDAGTIFPDLT